MSRTNTPQALWDYCCAYAVDLRKRLAQPLPSLQGRTPHELITGCTSDISEYLDFKWYDHVWYFDPSTFSEENKMLARWIGVAHRVG